MQTRRKGLWIILAAFVLAVGTYGIVRSMMNKTSTVFQTASITRGNLESTISATGTLTPLTKIDVGTQVSATIDTVMVDFNDTVRTGQVLAVLDTTVLSASVHDAEANLERCEAAVEQAEYNYKLNKSLFSKGMTSNSDSVETAVNYKTQLANLKSSKIALSRAKRNLEFAVILSPISGIVIEKNVEAGQTVAASFSTPTLFVIAKDLSSMEILTQVDESDIGQIKTGQKVRFEVATYAGKEFTGTVKQIRLQPATVSNVVTYTVVVEAANETGLLLPGMTATVDFITETRQDVLLVPSKALKFQPTEAQLATAMADRPAPPAGNTAPPPSGAAPAGAPGMGGTPPNMPDSASMQSISMVWYLDSAGKLTPAPIKIGMSDGTNTEIVTTHELSSGTKVVIGTGDSSSATKKTSSFGGPGGPPMGM
jgi:HlyD family secretion protein